MTAERRPLVAANWKMNKTNAEAGDHCARLRHILHEGPHRAEVAVCPPFTALGAVSKAILDSNIRLGAPNMSEHNSGAYTGEIAAGMLKLRAEAWKTQLPARSTFAARTSDTSVTIDSSSTMSTPWRLACRNRWPAMPSFAIISRARTWPSSPRAWAAAPERERRR